MGVYHQYNADPVDAIPKGPFLGLANVINNGLVINRCLEAFGVDVYDPSLEVMVSKFIPMSQEDPITSISQAQASIAQSS